MKMCKPCSLCNRTLCIYDCPYFDLESCPEAYEEDD